MKNNEIRLTEQELYSIIKESVIETLNEGKWGKVGDWLSAGALGAGLTAGAVGTMVQDPKYSDDVDMPSHEITVQPDEDEYEFETDIDPKYAENDELRFNESKMSKKIDRIIDEALSKVL